MLYVVLIVGLVAVTALSLFVGPGDLQDAALGSTFLSLRAARVLGAVLAGGALASGGALVQGLFRNPLASPSILGTTAGASFGGQCVLLLHERGRRVGPQRSVLCLPHAWFASGGGPARRVCCRAAAG